MKLRFHNDSLRLRLSQSEVAQLKETGHVENCISFAPGRTLVYSIESAPVPQVTAAFEGNHVSVVLPGAQARNWIDSDEAGIEGRNTTLHILVEKDYQCLHRSSEEDQDGFPNPLADQQTRQ